MNPTLGKSVGSPSWLMRWTVPNVSATVARLLVAPENSEAVPTMLVAGPRAATGDIAKESSVG